MLTNDAIVKVRNKPVSNVEQYLEAVEIRYADLSDIWNKYAAETQAIMGSNFVVTLKQNSNFEYQIQVHPVLRKKKVTVYVPVVKGKKKLILTLMDNFLQIKKLLLKWRQHEITI